MTIKIVPGNSHISRLHVFTESFGYQHKVEITIDFDNKSKAEPKPCDSPQNPKHTIYHKVKFWINCFTDFLKSIRAIKAFFQDLDPEFRWAKRLLVLCRWLFGSPEDTEFE